MDETYQYLSHTAHLGCMSATGPGCRKPISSMSRAKAPAAPSKSALKPSTGRSDDMTSPMTPVKQEHLQEADDLHRQNTLPWSPPAGQRQEDLHWRGGGCSNWATVHCGNAVLTCLTGQDMTAAASSTPSASSLGRQPCEFSTLPDAQVPVV